MYKYNEQVNIRELEEYVLSTYTQHYSQGNFQATEFIIDGGHGMGFCIGNIMKYAQRYGKKNGYNRADLMKVLHYGLIALYVHDIENANRVYNLEHPEEKPNDPPIEVNYNLQLLNEG
jgi:hypothetical protein